MRHEDRTGYAAAYLSTIGVLEECEVHGYTVGGERSLDDSWGIAVNDWKRGANGRAAWSADMTLPDYKEALQQAYSDNCGDCIGCMQAERE